MDLVRESNPYGARIFTPVQTGPVAHTDSCCSGYRFYFLGIKWSGRSLNHLPHLAQRFKKE